MTITQLRLPEATIAKERIYKILFILSFSSVIGAIFILWNNPILHYQLSAYSGLPAIVWVLLFLSFLLAGYVLLSSQTEETETANRWFLIGLTMIILVAAVVLLFPYIRGAWFMDKADQVSHVTGVATVLTEHHIYNYYPPLHLLGAGLVTITGISAYGAISLIGVLFYLLSIVWCYCLAKVVLKDRSMIALAVIAAATFPPGRIAAIPYYLSIMMLPLVISSYLTRHESVSHSITCLILLSAMVFLHPLTGLILMLCLLAIELFQYFQRSRAQRKGERQLIRTRAEYSAALFFSVGFLAWMVYLNIHLFASQVGRLIDAITSSIQVSGHQHHILSLPILGITGGEFALLFLKMYGANVIFLALTLIAMFLIYKRTYSGVANEYEHRLFSLSAWIIMTGLVVLTALIRPSEVYFDVVRLTFLLTVLTPIFVAYALHYIYTRLRDKITRQFHLISGVMRESLFFLPLTILSLVFIMMTFMVHPSTYVKQSNLQLMKAEIAGATWLLEHTNLEEDIEAYDLGINWRLVEVSVALSGYSADSSHSYVYFRKLTERLPDHMGYGSYETMGEYFGAIQLPTATGFELLDDGYVVLTRERTLRALELYAPMGWMSQDDLDRFYDDKTANLVYVNYEYTTFWVPPSH